MTKILIVEDNEMNRELLERRLRRSGFEVGTAADGQEGLEHARTGSYALILMDMSLPVLDGWEATRRLKADPATAAIPVIALTAHAMDGDRQRSLDSGCDDYDTKPIDWTRLKAKIDAWLTTPGAVRP